MDSTFTIASKGLQGRGRRLLSFSAGTGPEADSLELACAIELIRQRTDALLRLAAPRAG